MFQWWQICEGYQIRHLGILQPADEHLFFPCDFPANLRDSVRLAQKTPNPCALNIVQHTSWWIGSHPFDFIYCARQGLQICLNICLWPYLLLSRSKVHFRTLRTKSSTPKSHPGWKGCAKSWSSNETCLNWSYRLNTAKKMYRCSLFRSKGH